MFLLKLLALPVTAPTNGLLSVLNVVRSEVDKELYDPDTLRRELARLQAAVDAGELDETEYETLENELLDRLEAVEAAQRAARESQRPDSTDDGA